MAVHASESSPIRILFLTATSDRGGAETLLVELLSRLDREAFECRVVSFVGGGWLTRACERMGIPAANWTDRGFPGKAAALWRELRSFRPHLMHGFGLRAEAVGRPLARWSGAAGIISVAHSTDPQRHRLLVSLDRLTARYVDRFVAVGRAVAASRIRRERFPRNRVTVIPNGIRPPGEKELESKSTAREELLRELDLPADAGPLLLMVGNLRPMKGHAEALEALARLIPEFPRIRLVVVGRDVADGRHARRARELGCDDHVVWAGYRENTCPFLAGADLFLMPSYWEGCPTALLEAMGWELPIVASRIGGIAEVARADREAVLVAPRDGAALAEGVARLLREPVHARELAAAARRRLLDRYTLDRMVERHERLYRDLCAKAKPASLK